MRGGACTEAGGERLWLWGAALTEELVAVLQIQCWAANHCSARRVQLGDACRGASLCAVQGIRAPQAAAAQQRLQWELGLAAPGARPGLALWETQGAAADCV